MLVPGPSDLLHLVGFLTGAVLYGMLLAMAARPSARVDAFAVSTGVLGVAWNVGQLGAYAARTASLLTLASWIHAASFSALGLLASVVVHSVARTPRRLESQHPTLGSGSAIAVVVYGCAAIAASMHFAAAAAGTSPPSPSGLTWLTVGLIITIPPLVVLTRQQSNSKRALWMSALAVVAVSALHVGRFHGVQESWPVELFGHHASIVLAFAILHQDYRFALADLFLKQALAFLVLVALVFGGFSIVEPLLLPVGGRVPPSTIALLLALWTGTALILPPFRRAVAWFVDRVVLARADYGRLLGQLAEETRKRESAEAVLDSACRVVAPAVSATAVTWEERKLESPADVPPHAVAVWTAETPRYLLRIGPLLGGRRLLSDDLAMLERAAVLLARCIDALRLTGERYERLLQEREMRTLATEAELRALRAQIDPHFLFNALTTIGYLIQQAPPRALKTLMNLTTLLRSTLRSEGDFTTLGRERALVQCYLRIERERFEERLAFTVDIPDELLELSVPSLIVQPLVENAIKHGIAGARDGGTIAMTATLDDDLRIVVRNTGAPLGARTEPGLGVGLDNVRRRLQHYFGEEASVTVARDAEGATVAELRLPAADADDRPVELLRRSTAR